jgi:hypothetical protein
METRKRIPRKRLRLTRSLELEQRNVLRLRASFGTRVRSVKRLFNRLAPALEGTQRGHVTSNELSRSMESHLLRSLRRRGRCNWSGALFKKWRRQEAFTIATSQLFYQAPSSNRVRRSLLRGRSDWIRRSFAILILVRRHERTSRGQGSGWPRRCLSLVEAF